MLARNALLLLALSAVAGSAFAASPQAASASQPAKSTTVHKEKRTCEERGKTGHCEKWSKTETEKAAATK